VKTVLRRSDWFRIIPSRYPTVGIFEEVTDPKDLETVLLIEAATNPRILDEAGEIPLVRPEERITGPGSTPIMASFTHTKSSRFSDGRFGVFYAGHDEATAIAETAYHRSVFLRDCALPNERLDMRVYPATVRGQYDDIRGRAYGDTLYDPLSYHASQLYGEALYLANAVDGIVYRSVRHRPGECVCVFRPRLVEHCRQLRHLEYRFEDYHLVAVMDISARTR
jgi:hypothetical protein